MTTQSTLTKKLQDKSASIAILGLGYVGLPLAVLALVVSGCSPSNPSPTVVVDEGLIDQQTAIQKAESYCRLGTPQEPPVIVSAVLQTCSESYDLPFQLRCNQQPPEHKVWVVYVDGDWVDSRGARGSTEVRIVHFHHCISMIDAETGKHMGLVGYSRPEDK